MKVEYIQRLQLRTSGADKRTGVDRFFAMDYMGSSEFEFGALPASLRAMRETPRPEIQRIKVAGHVAWFVGPARIDKADITHFFRDQLDERPKIRLKERSRIRDAYIGSDWDGKKSDHIGWWDIGNHWVLFMKKDHARAWIDGVWPTEEMKAAEFDRKHMAT